MYLNHPLVPGFPLALRHGEERDRDFLSDVFMDVWEKIPEDDRAGILARGYGKLTVDVLIGDAIPATPDTTGNIDLSRTKVDRYPRNIITHIVARELAHRLDDFLHPDLIAKGLEIREAAKKRVVAILRRWGFPSRAKPVFTAADEERILANSMLHPKS